MVKKERFSIKVTSYKKPPYKQRMLHIEEGWRQGGVVGVRQPPCACLSRQIGNFIRRLKLPCLMCLSWMRNTFTLHVTFGEQVLIAIG